MKGAKRGIGAATPVHYTQIRFDSQKSYVCDFAAYSSCNSHFPMTLPVKQVLIRPRAKLCQARWRRQCGLLGKLDSLVQGEMDMGASAGWGGRGRGSA